MSRGFVIDEWIFSDLLGENGEENQAQTVQFLRAIMRICDHIICSKDIEYIWYHKSFQLMKGNSFHQRRISKLFHGAIISDSNKCEVLTNIEDVENRGIQEKDEYLLNWFYSTDADCIVSVTLFL